MKRIKPDMVTISLGVVFFIIIIIGVIGTSNSSDLEPKDPVKTLAIIFTLLFIATRLWKKEGYKWTPKKDAYEPTNYSAHSEFMNYGYLK